MEAGDVYPIAWEVGLRDLPKEIFFHRVLGQFPLPTEWIVTSVGQVVVPLMGRIFEVKPKGLVAVEVFGDYGDDGHTFMQLRAIMILTLKDVLVDNDLSFMKCSSWLYNLIEDKYNKWHTEKIWPKNQQ